MGKLIVSGSKNKEELCQDVCPPGWVSFANRCFQYIGIEKTWADAEMDCIELGGNLASVHSEEEETFLLHLIVSKRATSTWLGGSDGEQEGKWLWSDGSKWAFTKWNAWEPNNSGTENCLLTYWDHGNWNDMNCNNQFAYICAINP
nr:PREDICTED: ladderlectin-like [Lepisosteus oculatus]